ncbi:MAG: DUF3187 family protein, partial [Planctomycetes bacterium]|nr:DUF3187 family protein [Planctomycetota bacterium]
DRFELDVEFAVASTGGGFLDEFIVDWHDFFGFPNHGRDTAPKDQFVVRAERAGNVAFEVEERSLALLDLPVRAAWTLREPDADLPLAIAARLGVELPIGDDARGYGNGGVDLSIGLAADYRTEWLGWTAHVGHTFVETPDLAESAGLEFADVTTFGVGVEVPMTDDWHGIVQFDAETSTLRELDFARVSDEQLGLWFGARGRLADRTYLEFAIGEDLNEFIAPDFTLWFSLLQNFGTRRDV